MVSLRKRSGEPVIDTASRDRDDRTHLHHACVHGTHDDVRAALQAGADPNAQDKQGFTPLHFAAQEQRDDVARLLLDAGADVHLRNGWGNTALFTGVFNVKDGDGQIVRTLLAAGASPDVKNNHGVSPRELAAKVANYDLMRFFDDPV
jgi:ankyrin repeat protein